MSIFEITKNPDKVLAAVAQFAIKEKNVFEMTDL